MVYAVTAKKPETLGSSLHNGVPYIEQLNHTTSSSGIEIQMSSGRKRNQYRLYPKQKPNCKRDTTSRFACPRLNLALSSRIDRQDVLRCPLRAELCLLVRTKSQTISDDRVSIRQFLDIQATQLHYKNAALHVQMTSLTTVYFIAIFVVGRLTRNELAHVIVTRLTDPSRYDPRMRAQSGTDCERDTCDESPVHVKVNTYVRQMRFDQPRMHKSTYGRCEAGFRASSRLFTSH
ncbi:glutamate-gated chloride channel-like [Tropilaelaps mercedesae]|uniref:Glutamate-gated chloride channel-like n=1 Tax=Tropilaelaps mercedesae TaxID=418985 RepID=A0A1V9XBG7_9ACAR|nr:glutamate-gated chloride channel-like [Tropilaelaps mercedesae]